MGERYRDLLGGRKAWEEVARRCGRCVQKRKGREIHCSYVKWIAKKKRNAVILFCFFSLIFLKKKCFFFFFFFF